MDNPLDNLLDNLLDNPVWNAMISGNRSLSSGNDHAKCFDREVSPFVALREKCSRKSPDAF